MTPKISAFLSPLALLALGSLTGCGAIFPRYSTTVAEAPPGLVEGGEATPPPDTVVRVAAASGEVPPQTADARGWDGQGMPDPYVVVVRNGTEVYRSRVVNDSIRPTWDTAHDFADLHIEPNDTLHIELRDDDGLTADVIGVYDGRGLPAEARGGSWALHFPRGASVTLSVTPPAPHVGMGVDFEYHSDRLVVLRVEFASSANIAGLRAGDRIVAINGRPVSGLSEGEARQGMDQATIRDVSLTVQHANASSDETINVRRDALYPSR